MSKKILACQLGDELGHAEQVMRDARIRRLPVLNEQGALTGMISLADLAREAARERRMDTQDKEITETEVGDTLAAICAAPMQSMAA